MNFPTYEREDILKFRRIAGVDEAGRGCEHQNADILTTNGWKQYKDIDIKIDKVLSYTDNGTIEWQKIDCVIEKDFDGHLIELKNRGIHILVTPDHYFDVLRRTFKRDKLDDNKLKMAGYTFRGRKSVLDITSNDFIPRGGKWHGTQSEYFVLPNVEKLKYDNSGKNYEKKYINMEVWVSFLGIYLSEGSSSHSKDGSYVVKISQTKKDYYNKIYNLCKKLPFKIFKEKRGIIIRNKQLYTYLKQFGKCYDKFIPEEIKNLSPNLLNTLIDWMIIGDGACYKGKNRHRVCQYYTTSSRLKNDFEEILLKAGWTYHTTIREPRDSIIRDRKINKENCVPCYEIRLRRNNKAHVKSLHKKETPYKGKVFCLGLPKHHNFYVRRSGTGYFTGNCGAGPVVAAAVLIPEHMVPVLTGEVKDSKKLTYNKRRKLYDTITTTCEYGVGIIDNGIIDEINILEATKLAMTKAIGGIKQLDYVLIDGNMKLDLDVRYESIIKGDDTVLSIAAASIIAKVTRDRIMEELHEKLPIYGWDHNKGYLTKEHRDALKLYGTTPYHRISFRGVL